MADIIKNDCQGEDVVTIAYTHGFENGKAYAAAEIFTLKSELEEALEIIKSFHLDQIDYSVINNLSGHNNHNVRWARRYLGMKEEWSLDEAHAFLNRNKTDG